MAPTSTVSEKESIGTNDTDSKPVVVAENQLSASKATTVPAQVPQRPRKRNRWFALAVPVVLLLITASSHHITLRDLSGEEAVPTTPIVQEPLPPVNTGGTHDPWRHKRQASSPTSTPPSSGISFPSSPTSSSSSASATSTTSLQPYQQTLPTVPVSPPAEPTSFPEPLDTITQDFSTVGCQSFMEGLGQSSTLQACVPFSLLLQSSNAFISQTQNNLSNLNAVIYSSCNPQPSLSQCSSSLSQLAASLQTACKTDLANHNPQAQSTLTALLAYGPMQAAACTSSPTTNAYCYVTAVHSTNPSDLYFFQLPLGISLPNNTTPSCSGCTKSVMALYGESASAGNLSGLDATYSHAAQVATDKCGAGYVEQVATTSKNGGRGTVVRMDISVLLGVIASTSLVLASWL